MKQFEKIAEIINQQVGDAFTGEDYDRGWHDATKRIAEKLCELFKEQNRFFDPVRFLLDCGFEVGIKDCLAQCEKDYEYLKDVLAEIQELAESKPADGQMREVLEQIAAKARDY
ncbi:MAG: hypothetical protein JW720_13240 [Sedimentisphaerales bacterium]|nr:hypothetical protein [Sedimentisphaerales bacterium]